MKKVIINVFVCVLIFCEIFGNDVVKISAATNKKAEVTNEMKMLKESGVPVANIDDVQMGEENTYTIKSGSKTEEISVESAGNNAIEFSVTDGHIKNQISYSDGELIIDGNKIKVTTERILDDSESGIAPCATIWKGTKSLKPYGGLKASDYNKFLASGKQNIALGKAMDALTVTALSTIIAKLHPYAQIAVNLFKVAKGVKTVIESINPKTKYLGCKYKTYTHGAYDFKYINKFYANKKCTGKYKKTKSYEHFIVY